MSDPAQPQPSSPPVEVLDAARRVVAVLPAAEVARQKLAHRAVAILVFDDAGRLYLRRRPTAPGARGPGRWDAPARGPALAGESMQDAAARTLEARLGVRSERLRPLLELPATPENGNEFLQVFSLTRPEAKPEDGPAPEQTAEYGFTSEELGCLLRDFRELVAPRFLLLAEEINLRGLWRRRP